MPKKKPKLNQKTKGWLGMRGIFAPNARKRGQGTSDMSLERWARDMADAYDNWRGRNDELETAENITLSPNNGGMFNMGGDDAIIPQGDCEGGACAAYDGPGGGGGTTPDKEPWNPFESLAAGLANRRGRQLERNRNAHRFFKKHSNYGRIGRGGKFGNAPLMQLAAQLADYRVQKLKSRGEANKNY